MSDRQAKRKRRDQRIAQVDAAQREEIYNQLALMLDNARNQGKNDLIAVMLQGLSEVDTTDLFTAGWSAGWNAAVEIIQRRFEPLMHRQIETQHKVGFLHGVIARDESQLPTDVVEHVANLIGHDLADLDTLDRAFCAPFGVERYIDQTSVHELRNVAIDAAHGRPGAAARLRDLLRDNPEKARFADIMSSMKQRARKRLDDTMNLAQTMQAILEDAKRSGEKVTLEKAAIQAMEQIGKTGYWTTAAAIQHYYRVCKGKS